MGCAACTRRARTAGSGRTYSVCDTHTPHTPNTVEVVRQHATSLLNENSFGVLVKINVSMHTIALMLVSFVTPKMSPHFVKCACVAGSALHGVGSRSANTMWRKLLYSGFERCFGPSTQGAGTKTHLKSRFCAILKKRGVR